MEKLTTDLPPEQINRLMQKQIFRPSKPTGRFKNWYRLQLLKQLSNCEAGKPRYVRIHGLLKRRIVQPAIGIVKWLLRKHIVTRDTQIPHEWHNNHIRIFRHCFYQANWDMWERMVWVQHKAMMQAQGKPIGFKDSLDYVEWQSKAESYNFRTSLIDIWMTEVLEDTADREWLNFAVLRITKETARHYGVTEAELAKIPNPGEFPVYLACGPNNPPYFIENANHPVWRRREMELHEVLYERKAKEAEDKQERAEDIKGADKPA